MSKEWGGDPNHHYTEEEAARLNKRGSCLLRAITILGLGSFLLYAAAILIYEGVGLL